MLLAAAIAALALPPLSSTAVGPDTTALRNAVTVAGVTVPGQAVECARQLSDSFLQDGGNDGLLGLAWPSINTVSPYPVKTPVQNMIDQGLIDQPLFTVKLGHGKEPSFYSFGA